MARLIWSPDGYSAGVDRGVLYLEDNIGVVWNGLISVEEAPGASALTPLYFDGKVYAVFGEGENYLPTVTAFTYPKEFELYDGTRDILGKQPRRNFGFCYRETLDDGYILHLVYNALAEPIVKKYQTNDDSPDPSSFSWKFQTRPENFPGGKPAAHFLVDSRLSNPYALKKLEDALYGSDTNSPYLPTIDEVIDFFEDFVILKITNHGDGTWTAEGPDDVVYMVGPTEFGINWPSLTYLDAVTYEVSSL